MKTKSYQVFLSKDGSGQEYIGEASSIRKAERLATRHGRGEIDSLPEHLYATARAAGHCFGGKAPRGVCGEPVKWTGRGGWYAICPVVSN